MIRLYKLNKLYLKKKKINTWNSSLLNYIIVLHYLCSWDYLYQQCLHDGNTIYWCATEYLFSTPQFVTSQAILSHFHGLKSAMVGVLILWKSAKIQDFSSWKPVVTSLLAHYYALRTIKEAWVVVRERGSHSNQVAGEYKEDSWWWASLQTIVNALACFLWGWGHSSV